MASTAAVPTRRLPTTWGVFTALCGHPHSIHFNAGEGTELLDIEGHRYLANITARQLRVEDPDRRRHARLAGRWAVVATEALMALSYPNGVAAPDPHGEQFVRDILPVLGTWLRSTPAVDLMTEGTAYWRRESAARAANTLADLDHAAARVRRILAAIEQGSVPAARDEYYLREARVHPR